ncbi:hypothetical protein TD95_005318 [Thielaviopsis punctulata]|uniref:Zn(2)-C6 fungal-type domain-containing protein n=1 Tax=Thielaviopsis punctulata TaxID=72032 RepID=A0A0F4ZA74_9PEZI|nr:hypothetical protein TD95_005318 [Thielaviopsis punctulata]
MNRPFTHMPVMGPGVDSIIAPGSLTPETSPTADRSSITYTPFQNVAAIPYPNHASFSQPAILPTHQILFSPASAAPQASVVPVSVAPAVAAPTSGTARDASVPQAAFPPATTNGSPFIAKPEATKPATKVDAGPGQNGAHDNALEASSSASSPYGNVTPGTQSPASREERKKIHKQKRNKPTLSCSECVERKTKCDRGRPTCFACKFLLLLCVQSVEKRMLTIWN